MFDWVLNTSLNIEQTVVNIEPATGGCSVKKVFLEISQNLQENTCVRVSFLIKLQTFCNFIRKRDSDTLAFLWISRNFYRTTPNDCFCKYILNKYSVIIYWISMPGTIRISITHIDDIYKFPPIATPYKRWN